MIDTTKYYVFYDGDCGFCNYWIRWILKNDRKNQFLFSALQSDFGQEFLHDRHLENQIFSTLYLWKPKSFYLTKSQAVFAIARILGGKFGIIGNLNFFPNVLSDFVYDKVAANRQKFSNQKCFVPTPEEKTKFISQQSDFS